MMGWMGKAVKFVLMAVWEVVLGIIKWFVKKVIQVTVLVFIFSSLSELLIKMLTTK